MGAWRDLHVKPGRELGPVSNYDPRLYEAIDAARKTWAR